MRQRILAALPVVIGLALFLAALEVLRLELRPVSWHELTADVVEHAGDAAWRWPWC